MRSRVRTLQPPLRFESPAVGRSALAGENQTTPAYEEIALRLGANVARHCEEAGLSLRQFAEAAETHFTHLSKVERGKSGVPQLSASMPAALSSRSSRSAERRWSGGAPRPKLRTASRLLVVVTETRSRIYSRLANPPCRRDALPHRAPHRPRRAAG